MAYNFNECKKGNPVKDKAREIVLADLAEFFHNRYGEDTMTQVDGNMLAVAVGNRTLADGTEGEVCVTVEVVAKDYDVRVVESSGKVFQPYERLIEGDEPLSVIPQILLKFLLEYQLHFFHLSPYKLFCFCRSPIPL